MQPCPDGWHDQLVAECHANGIETTVNEYGTPVSVHWCAAGGHRYTVCPPSPREGPDCCVGDCVSYDPSRDASVFFAPADASLIE